MPKPAATTPRAKSFYVGSKSPICIIHTKPLCLLTVTLLTGQVENVGPTSLLCIDSNDFIGTVDHTNPTSSRTYKPIFPRYPISRAVAATLNPWGITL